MSHLLDMYLKNYLPGPASPAFCVGILKVLADFTMMEVENLLLISAEKCQDKIIFETKQFMQLSAHSWCGVLLGFFFHLIWNNLWKLIELLNA